MFQIKKSFLLIVSLLILSLPQVSFAQSGQALLIKDVRVDGLQRVPASTVFDLLPLNIGSKYSQDIATVTIRDLYKTGLFQDVDIFFKNQVVYVKLVENPSIASVSFVGNSTFGDEIFQEVFRLNKLIEGDVYRPQTADKLIKEIKSQYLNEGKYAAKVELKTTPLDRSRVALELQVNEGETATVKKITIIGNKHFTDGDILDRFETKSSRGLNPFAKANRYSREKLTADIESMVSMYKDAGFADFAINSSRVSITPEKDGVFVTLSVSEGARYKVKQFSLSGRLVVTEQELLPLVAIRPQDYYSQADVQKTVDNITNRLADEGFSNARVVPVPSFDTADQTVSFSININPAKTVFVRRIELQGNDKTSSQVLRRELRQVEGAPLSAKNIQLSKTRLRRLSYISNVDIQVKPVPEDEEQVDLIVKVTEVSSAQISFGAGYSDADGAILQAAYLENNFLGTGKTVDLKVDTSDANKTLRFNYRNPYVTKSGVSRNIGINFNRRDTEQNDTSDYLSDTIGLNVGYRFPIGEFGFLSLGGTLEKIELDSTESTAPEISSFIDANPDNNQLRFNARWGYDSRDSFLTPTSGWNNYINLETAVPGSDLEYYKLDLNSTYYIPLTNRFTFKLTGQVGIGDGFGDTEELPFFKNYFAGGTGTVRGFDSRSLGPRDTSEDQDPLGGAKRVIFNASLLTPIPGVEDDGVGRLGFFVDAAQVFANEDSIDFSDLRASAGISVNWLTAIGPLAISYAVPINDEEGDELEKIQFSIGRFLD